jgi:acyl-coenzyme A synthetase/AMP-(fatty) acid ligase
MTPNMTNYEDTYNQFTWNIPERFNFGFDIVDKWAEKPDKLALVSVDNSGDKAQRHTFRELSCLSNKLANTLRKHGVHKGDRVLIMLPRVPEWYVAVLGAIKLGAIFMPTPTLSTAKDIEYRIKQSEAVAAMTSSEFATRFQEIKARCPSLKTLILTDGDKHGWVDYEREMTEASAELELPETTKSTDPMLIYFTSGTTGYPKMVLHTQAYALAHIVTAKYVHDLKPTDLHWTIADTGWAKTAWGKLFGQWILGTAVLQHNVKGNFEPKTALKVLERYGITTFCAPPTIYRMLILEDLRAYQLGKLRHCVSAGEPLNAESIRAWKFATGLEIYDCYGQTESVCLLGNYPCLPIKPGSTGKPTPGHIVSIVDDEGNELPPGRQGKIAVKVKPVYPPGLFKEYWRDPEAMKRSFRGDWYYTGDVAYTDEDGYFWFVGRDDDVIKSSGYRIGPFEVESALQEHPAVAESAVVGIPDPVRGQIVKAFVVLVPGYNGSDELTKELQEMVKQITAPYKYPREIEYVAELPKTVSGKIIRSELRKRSPTSR